MLVPATAWREPKNRNPRRFCAPAGVEVFLKMQNRLVTQPSRRASAYHYAYDCVRYDDCDEAARMTVHLVARWSEGFSTWRFHRVHPTVVRRNEPANLNTKPKQIQAPTCLDYNKLATVDDMFVKIASGYD